MSKAEDRETALSQALRKELKGSSLSPAALASAEKKTPGKGRIDVLLELLAKPDDELVRAEAAAVILERGPRSLRDLAARDEATFGPDLFIGRRRVRAYSIGRLRKMREALDLHIDGLVSDAAARRAAAGAGERIEKKTFRSIEDLNKAVLAGVTQDGIVVDIVLRYRVPGPTAPIAGFVCTGLHELLTGYLWEDPDLLLDWQNAYRAVVLDALTDELVEAHAASSSARLQRVLGGGQGDGQG